MSTTRESSRRCLTTLPCVVILATVCGLGNGRPATAGPIFSAEARAFRGRFLGIGAPPKTEKKVGEEPVSVQATQYVDPEATSEVISRGRAAAGRFFRGGGGIFLKGKSRAVNGAAALTRSKVEVDDLVFSGPADEVRFFPLVHIDGVLRTLNFGGLLNRPPGGTLAEFRIDYQILEPRFFGARHQVIARVHLDSNFGRREQGLSRDFEGFPDITNQQIGNRPPGLDHDIGAIKKAVLLGGGGAEIFFGGTIRAVNGPLRHPAVMPTGVPLELTLGLQTQVSTRGDSKRATADFGDTFGLPTSGPVFDLPPGFTANSQQAGIVNNRLVGTQQTVIPEPSSFALLGIGAFGLLGYGWRRRRTAGAKS